MRAWIFLPNRNSSHETSLLWSFPMVCPRWYLHFKLGLSLPMPASSPLSFPRRYPLLYLSHAWLLNTCFPEDPTDTPFFLSPSPAPISNPSASLLGSTLKVYLEPDHFLVSPLPDPHGNRLQSLLLTCLPASLLHAALGCLLTAPHVTCLLKTVQVSRPS